MKILHAEFGGLVIYHMKLERGMLALPHIAADAPSPSREIKWSDLIMMVRGLSSGDVRKRSRWEPEKTLLNPYK